MKTYNIDIVKCLEKDTEKYYIFDFTITRPLVGNETSLFEAMAFARGYRSGIMIDSKLEFKPEILDIVQTNNLDDYVVRRKKYYDELWEKEV